MTSIPNRVRALVRRRNHETLVEEEDGWEERENQNSNPTPGTSNGMNNSGDYTELMGGSVPCPSCKGTGRIPKEWEETLVALVPFTDERLKPKKTWLYATIVIVICLVMAASAIFMLIPRSVELIPRNDPVATVNITSWTNSSIEMFFSNSINLTNNNYYPVDVVNASIVIIGKQNPYNELRNGTGGNVAALLWSHEKDHVLVFNNTLKIENVVSLHSCQSDWARIISTFVYFQFDITLNISYFNHFETKEDIVNDEQSRRLFHMYMGFPSSMQSAGERIRSFFQRTFGNHDTLEEEREDWTPFHNSEPGSSRSVTTDYTELMGGSVPCPSCKGTGRIPKEMEETLVALIPLNDERLKPKRTWLYVLGGIVACTLIAATAIFMLVPRAVEISGSRHPINLIHVTKATKNEITFHFMNFVNISNYNYYSIQVVNTSAIIISKFYPWNTEQSGTGSNTTAITVTPLSYNSNKLYFNNTVTLMEGVAEYCQASFSRITSLYVNMQFDVTVQLTYFNHHEQVTLSANQQVCCIPSGNCTSS